MKSFRVILFLVASCSLFLQVDGHAYIFLEGPQDSSAINAEWAIIDDENEPDQDYPVEGNYLVEIKNGNRRYVGIYIDRIVRGPGGQLLDQMVVDNGPNDVIIGTATELFSLQTVGQYLNCALYDNEECAPPPASRTYILPVPETLEPGTEIEYRIQVIGPAFGDQIPVDPFDLADPRAELVLRATALTTFEMLVLPLVSSLTGAKLNDLGDAVSADFASFIGKSNTFWKAWEESDYYKITSTILEWMAGSEVFQTFLKSLGQGSAAAILSSIADLILYPISIGELSHMLVHLGSSYWLEEFTVYLIVPRVTEIIPNQGEAGDPVTIKGKGFDPDVAENNEVWFTLDEDAWVQAGNVGAVDENTITATVPVGFIPGPVKVCAPDYCSNEDVLFGVGSEPSLRIVSPADGAVVTEAVAVEVEILNPPDPFLTYAVQLNVDGAAYADMTVNAAQFSLQFNPASFSAGIHTLQAVVTIGADTISASVAVDIAPSGAVQLVLHAPSNGQVFARNEMIAVDAQVLNGPEPGVYRLSRFQLFLDGVELRNEVEIVRDYTYPGCYRKDLSFFVLNAAEGVHELTVIARDEQSPTYEVSQTVQITLGPEVGEEGHFYFGDSCSLNATLSIPYSRTSPVPVDLTFHFGYCRELNEWGKIEHYRAVTRLWKNGLTQTSASIVVIQGGFFRIYWNLQTAWQGWVNFENYISDPTGLPCPVTEHNYWIINQSWWANQCDTVVLHFEKHHEAGSGTLCIPWPE